MGACLDRFSQVMPWERKINFVDNEIEYQIEEVVICSGCGEEISEDENFLSSELWEDEYVHNHEDCINKYCEKEKDPFAVNKRVV